MGRCKQGRSVWREKGGWKKWCKIYKDNFDDDDNDEGGGLPDQHAKGYNDIYSADSSHEGQERAETRNPPEAISSTIALADWNVCAAESGWHGDMGRAGGE